MPCPTKLKLVHDSLCVVAVCLHALISCKNTGPQKGLSLLLPFAEQGWKSPNAQKCCRWAVGVTSLLWAWNRNKRISQVEMEHFPVHKWHKPPSVCPECSLKRLTEVDLNWLSPQPELCPMHHVLHLACFGCCNVSARLMYKTCCFPLSSWSCWIMEELEGVLISAMWL